MTDNGQETRPRRLALVASKGSLDMAYPPLILASTAAALDWEVGVFCTFYGLDLINKKKLPVMKVAPVGNPAMPPPFSGVPIQVPNIVGMLPGATALATSFMKGWMENANMPTVEELLDTCLEDGGQLLRVCHHHGRHGRQGGGPHRGRVVSRRRRLPGLRRRR